MEKESGAKPIDGSLRVNSVAEAFEELKKNPDLNEVTFPPVVTPHETLAVKATEAPIPKISVVPDYYAKTFDEDPSEFSDDSKVTLLTDNHAQAERALAEFLGQPIEKPANKPNSGLFRRMWSKIPGKRSALIRNSAD